MWLKSFALFVCEKITFKILKKIYKSPLKKRFNKHIKYKHIKIILRDISILLIFQK